MTWEPKRLSFAPRSLRDLGKLDSQIKTRVVESLERFAETGHGDVRKLRGAKPPKWRLRVGDWRAIFRYDLVGEVIDVLRVRHRRDAYR